MFATKRLGVGLLALLGVAGWAYAGPYRVNLLANGEFELDPPYTKLPTGWTHFWTDDSGWDGVVCYGFFGGQPYDRPDGQCPPNKCYGDLVLVDYDYSYGRIKQTVHPGYPGEATEFWIGGWVYTADVPGAYVKFQLDQTATGAHWESDEIYWYCGDPCWTWHEFAVNCDYGFDGGDVTFTVEIQTAAPAPINAHGMFVDGLEVEGAKCCDNDPFADADGDGDVDQEDFGLLQVCITGYDDPCGYETPIECRCFDYDEDGAVGQLDVDAFEACAETSGPGIPADKDCDGDDD